MISGYHQQIAEHYEKYPYPHYPWYAMGSWKNLRTVDLSNWGIERKIERAWIAGCGTIAPLMFGRRNPDVEFLATDLSTKSLMSLRRRLFLFGIHNLILEYSDIIESRYRDAFDAIDCYGVLHHMAAPQKGLIKLADALRPGGVLRLMVYSRRAREKIEDLRKQIVEAGCKDISQVQEFLNRGQQPRTGDFKTHSGIADALLNPIVHTYTEQSLAELLAAAPQLQEIRRDESGNWVVWLRKKGD